MRRDSVIFFKIVEHHPGSRRAEIYTQFFESLWAKAFFFLYLTDFERCRRTDESKLTPIQIRLESGKMQTKQLILVRDFQNIFEISELSGSMV